MMLRMQAQGKGETIGPFKGLVKSVVSEKRRENGLPALTRGLELESGSRQDIETKARLTGRHNSS